MNLDELRKQIELDELGDAELLKPIEYAKLRGIYAQRVYKALRNRQLERVTCEHCGHTGISVEAADAHFGFKKEVNDDEADSSD